MEKGETFPAPHARNVSKDSKWWPSFLRLTLSESWGNNTHGQ
jgi:hypothetical protein